MKLPSSSSVLLATLAISSSSSSLAAPAGECDTAITTSSSNRHIPALLSSSAICDLDSADIDIEQGDSTTVERSGGEQSLIVNQRLETHSGLQLVQLASEDRRNGSISGFLGLLRALPIIGHPVALLIGKSFPNGTDSVEGMADISPDDLQALQAAIAEVSRALGHDQTASAVPSAIRTAPTAMSNGDGPNTDSSASNSTSPALADPANTASSLSRPSAVAARSATMAGAQTPSMSPTIPGNPPNTPVPPAAHAG